MSPREPSWALVSPREPSWALVGVNRSMHKSHTKHAMGDASDHFFSNCRVDIRREVVRAIRAAVSVYKSLNYRIANAIPKSALHAWPL